MDSRHRNWSEMFAATADTVSALQACSTTASSNPPAPHVVPPASQLEELWAQSLALREHALHVRAVSMEVRAVARDMRLRRDVA
jgi:hypothetical protein